MVVAQAAEEEGKNIPHSQHDAASIFVTFCQCFEDPMDSWNKYIVGYPKQILKYFYTTVVPDLSVRSNKYRPVLSTHNEGLVGPCWSSVEGPLGVPLYNTVP